MKHLFCVAILLALALLPAAGAGESPDDQYFNIYLVIQEADKLADQRHFAEALAKYTEAQTDLKNLKEQHPDWSPTVVNFRLDYLTDKVAAVTLQIPPPPKVVTNEPPAVVVTEAPINAAVPPPPPQPPPDYENNLRSMQGQLLAANAENSRLQAKLKEALSVQPASLDPQELQRAQDQIRELQKEKE